MYTLNQSRTLAPLALLITGTTWAAASTLTIASPIAGSLALARYVASVHRHDLFSESGLGDRGVTSQPSEEQRPGGPRKARESERSEYRVLESDGDPTLTQKVIAPYLAEDEQIENLPLSSIIITPKNYNFHFIGEATIANTLAAVFRIVPKKKTCGPHTRRTLDRPCYGRCSLGSRVFRKDLLRRYPLHRYCARHEGSGRLPVVANHTPRGPNTEGGTGLFDHNGVPSRRDYRDRRTRLSIAVRLEVKL